MIVGVPKEIKNNEYRVGLTPKSVDEITSIGHDVYVENNAGFEIGYTNQNYIESGAKIINSAEEVYKSSELIVKVKEPLSSEFNFINKDNICAPEKMSKAYFSFVRRNSIRNLSKPANTRYWKNKLPCTSIFFLFDHK